MVDECDFLIQGRNEDDKGEMTSNNPAISLEEGISIIVYHDCALIKNGLLCMFPGKFCQYVVETQELVECLQSAEASVDAEICDKI